MPVTSIWYPILSQFLCAVEKSTGMPAQPLDADKPGREDHVTDSQPKKLPKGVVLGPDGKP